MAETIPDFDEWYLVSTLFSVEIDEEKISAEIIEANEMKASKWSSWFFVVIIVWHFF